MLHRPKRGLTKVDVDKADLLIDYHSGELINESVPPFTSSDTSPLPTTYHGDLAIDMYYPVTQKLVWRGTASKKLDPKAKPEKRQKNLNKAVAKMMKNYPPPQ